MYDGPIEFILSDLCKTCICQMVALATTQDYSNASAVRLSAHETVKNLQSIAEQAQAAMAYLADRR